MKAWQGRFSEATHPVMESFNESISVDQKLISEDIDGSIAHVNMLKRIGVLSAEEQKLIVDHLIEIQKEYLNSEIDFSIVDEDIHMAIEKKLIEKIGDVAKKMHTGRSRNDQVATDLRLYCKKEIAILKTLLAEFISTLLELSEKHQYDIMPGFTHLQKAQPILLSFYLNAYSHMFKRDIERLEDALMRVLVLPLGSGALAGTNYPTDRNYMVEKLGFIDYSQNALDAISDRDFIIEIESTLSIIMMHFSRLSEDLIIWNSESFGYITISDQFSTGSSLMPQKKNPDACELARGKTGRVFGNLMSILTIMKGLPMSYNKDMQEDKEGLFDSVETVKAVTEIYTKMMTEITFHTDRMLNDVSKGFLNATDLADYLVKKSMPFRQAHHIVGEIVKYCQSLGTPIECLELSKLKDFSELIDGDVYKVLMASVNGKLSKGSTNVVEVKNDLDNLKQLVKEWL